jgi:hypothetical protein
MKERRDKQRSPRTQQIPRVKGGGKREDPAKEGKPEDAAEKPPANQSGAAADSTRLPAHRTIPES